MKNLSEVLEGVQTVAIGGHVRPDGDCFGSCMAVYLYLKKWFPDIRTDLYLEAKREIFRYLAGFEDIRTTVETDMAYDLFITCDVSSLDRLAVARELFEKAGHTVCIDHHISNHGFAETNHVRGEIGSACEVIYHLMDPDKIDRDIATALYTGMAHDTGVFQYSNTTPETMRIAGELMKTGFDFCSIIDESFYQKTYVQNQVMGRVLAESIMLLDGKCIVGYLKRRDMQFYGITGEDLEGVVAQLRLTTGVYAAIFLYEMEPGRFKVSLRSNGQLDVSRVAVALGGGGHLRASGCDMAGTLHDVINNITEQIEMQFQELGL